MFVIIVVTICFFVSVAKVCNFNNLTIFFFLANYKTKTHTRVSGCEFYRMKLKRSQNHHTIMIDKKQSFLVYLQLFKHEIIQGLINPMIL